MSGWRATYRLQLGPELDLEGARALVPYLRDLGVSHLYLSPVWQARAGSTHGYDVTDPTRVSEELGGEAALRALAAEGLGLVLDVVPNHMAAVDANPYWRDPELRRRVFDLDRRTGRHRRFFDVDDLAGVRVEDPEVFALTQGLVLALVREGVADGLRIDHPDGLADPAGYLRRLAAAGADPVWVEKILEPGERLRDWPVAGTTGYSFLNEVGRLFVDPAGEGPLTDLYREVTGEERPFAEIAREAKREQARTTFAPEVERLARELDDDDELSAAVAALPVYRTYVDAGTGRVADADREAVREAMRRAGLSERVARVLLLEEPGHEDFVTRFQQTTGAVMAKGVEDTAFYRYNRLVSLNEVGGDPGRFTCRVDEFHAASLERAERFPLGLLATQTHDTKRSADVRARLGALSELAPEWAERVRAWRELGARLRRGPAPDVNEEYLVLQTLAGAWPLPLDRLLAYVRKALREEKVNTSWTEPDEAWEEAVAEWCRGLCADPAFAADLDDFAGRLAGAGERAALGQVALKLTSPGLPDLYQGDELWDLSLVDPDNRRPVDWGRRRRLLGDLRAGAPARRETAKLALVAGALDLRRRRPEPFAGAYTALEAGPEVCAFARDDEVLVVVPLRLRAPRGRLELPRGLRGRWRDVLGGAVHDLGARTGVAGLGAGAPAAILERADSGDLRRSRRPARSLPSPAVRPRRLAAAVLAVALLGATAAGASGAPDGTAREPRVTLIGDSVSAALDYAPAAARYLGRGLDLKLDAKVCRRLVAPSCSYMGTTPSTALSLIQARGSSLGGTVVMDVGYNEDASVYARDLDTIMAALVKAKVRRVVWVTLREERPSYSEINGVIRAAPARWSRLSVADWNAASSGEPWFSGDGLHLSGAGAQGLADFLRPEVLDAVRAGRSAARPSSSAG